MTAAPAPPGDILISARGLSRSYGHVRALRDVSFDLSAGQVLAVFGPNGAGKTTLLRLLAGLLRPDTGEVLVGGARLGKDDAPLRRRLGLISHHSLCYDGLTAFENLVLYARLYGLSDAAGAARRALASVALDDRADTPAGAMSRGMVQRLAIARALLHQPDVVLLDEPFTGLDQKAAAALRRELAQLAGRSRALVLVTHNLDEGLELASHVAIMNAGRFVELAPRSGDVAGYRERYAEATRG